MFIMRDSSLLFYSTIAVRRINWYIRESETNKKSSLLGGFLYRCDKYYSATSIVTARSSETYFSPRSPQRLPLLTVAVI